MESKEIFAPVVIRKSAFFLLVNIIMLESLFAVIFLLMRSPVHLFDISFIEFDDIYFIYTFIFILLTGIKLFLLFSIILSWMNNYYEILQGQLIHKKGIFKIKSTTFSLGNIELQEVEQGFLGRIFKYGTIEIFNPLLKQTFWLENVPFPHKQLKAIQHESHSNSDDTKIIPM